MDVDLDRFVVLIDTANNRYVGYLPDVVSKPGANAKVTPEEYMYHHGSGVVELKMVRTLMVNREVRMRQGAEGQLEYAGLQSFSMIIPLELAEGPVEKLFVRPSAWYFPKDNKSQAKGFADLLRKAEENEKLTAAAKVLKIPGVNA